MLVCLGAVAAQALLGSKVRVTKDRGKPLESELAPSSSSRSTLARSCASADEPAREQAFAAFVADLRVAAAELNARVIGVSCGEVPRA